MRSRIIALSGVLLVACALMAQNIAPFALAVSAFELRTSSTSVRLTMSDGASTWTMAFPTAKPNGGVLSCPAPDANGLSQCVWAALPTAPTLPASITIPAVTVPLK